MLSIKYSEKYCQIQIFFKTLSQASVIGGLTFIFSLVPLYKGSDLALAASLYKLPFPGGEKYKVTKGNPEHAQGTYPAVGRYAFDFGLNQGEPVVAARDGVVIRVKEDSNFGCTHDASYCDPFANYIVIDHGDGESTLYLHLDYNSVSVEVNQLVKQGQEIAKAGDTGYSFGAHLHFSVQQVPTAGRHYANGLNKGFSDPDVLAKSPDGIPKTGQTYISSNLFVQFDRQQAEDQVKQLYRDVVGREGDAGEVDGNVNLLANGGNLTQVRSNLATSPESKSNVNKIYQEVLGREGDSGGVEGNVKLLANGGKLTDVRSNLATSPEARSNINKIYQDILGREGDADGIQGFVNALGKDSKLSDVRYAIANSNEAANQIKNIFQEILNRYPDDNDLSQWTKRLSQSQPETFTLNDVRKSVETAKVYNLSPQKAFIDVPLNQTFAKDIYDLAKDGVISGFGDGYFRPDWNVTRGQFAKFVSNGFGFTPNTSCGNFLDIDSSNTFYSYITTLKCEGIINGNNGYFLSDLNVTRGEAAKFIINALQKQNNDYSLTSNLSSNSAFKDVPETYTFYKEIMGAYKAHIVDGFDPSAPYGQNTFMPDSSLTRGAASKLVNRGRSLLTSPTYNMTNAGLNQKKSLTPSVTKNGWKYFFDVPTDLWFDPPTTYGFKFEALENSLFTSLLDFPTGVAADNLFTVSVANQILGNFTPGQSVDFVSLLGSGVSEFTVTIASLLENTNTTTDVPFQLAFDKENGSFRMQEIEQKDSEQVPEPSSILGTLLGLGFLGIRSRQKQKATVNSR